MTFTLLYRDVYVLYMVIGMEPISICIELASGPQSEEERLPFRCQTQNFTFGNYHLSSTSGDTSRIQYSYQEYSHLNIPEHPLGLYSPHSCQSSL